MDLFLTITNIVFTAAGYYLPCANDKLMTKTYTEVDNFTTSVTLEMGDLQNRRFGEGMATADDEVSSMNL